MVAKDVKWLLQQKYHLFWSQVIFDDTLHGFIDSYLQHAPRDHDGSSSIFKVCAGRVNQLHLQRLRLTSA